ncbi:WD repeat-containing protein 27-like [Argiope bruennichi]|uniref:WD repeat-containing protein 27 n=1 Tax=Argiope bruennichi TaxID=94029 RepID=A0A8T0F6G1_ARGBR|nr:WD repeat-containing protein 27-like [Argiope bruennichi]KAF8786784.1 WD repeat-containing protein 27 [Argiope bruennichi]
MSEKFFYRLSCPTSMVTHLCECSEDYIAVPLNERGNIAVWSMKNILQEPLILIGHHKLVSALAFSHHPSNYFLCSCSSDNIILWNLMQNDGQPSKGRVLHSHMEIPTYCSFSLDNSQIAVSFPNGMWIFNLQKNTWVFSVEENCFIMFAFGCENDFLLGIEENFLKVWNYKTNEVTKKVSVSVGFPTAFCTHNQSGTTVVGTTCGHLNVYDKNYNLIRNILVWKLIAQQLKTDSAEDGAFQDFKSDSFPVYYIKIFHFETISNPYNCLPENIYLLIVTSTCLFLLKINNEEVILFIDFNGPSEITEIKSSIGLIRSGMITCNSDNSEAYVILIPVLDEFLMLIKLSLSDVLLSESTISSLRIESGSHILTFLNSKHVENSKSLLIPKIQKTKTSKGLKKGLSKKNLPVTFHSNIKSSGYGTLHKPFALFQPHIPKGHRYRTKRPESSRKFRNNGDGKKNIFECDSNPINFENLELLSKIESFENPVMSSLQVSIDGQFVSCTSSDGLTDILKLGGKHLKVFRSIGAHKGKVNSAKWSHSNKLLITAGNDQTVKVWDLERNYPLLNIGTDNFNSAAVEKCKFVFEDAVEQAQFYYLDRFLLATAGSCLHLFEYKINLEPSGIKSFINKSSLKLVKKIPLETKRITSLAAMNQFFSNLVLCSGTSKHIDVLDMTVGKVIHRMVDSSIKPAHLICLNEGSPYTTQSSSMYDLFLTTSLFDGIKIWDLRTNKPALCFKEHKCRSIPCGASFSPCGKYVATGSEDRSIYIYDLRQLHHQHKINDCQADVFTSVAFSPKSQLLASSLNGLIHLYGKNID